MELEKKLPKGLNGQRCDLIIELLSKLTGQLELFIEYFLAIVSNHMW